MDEKASNYLRGFYSYERSFNLYVLSGDHKMKHEYNRARQTGKLPFNRTKILILGDHMAGKTSTSRRLQGKDFRHNEASTEGIETNTLKATVNDVNSKWCNIVSTPLEDYEMSAAWWAVSQLRRIGQRDDSQRKPRKSGNIPILTMLQDALYQFLQIVPMIIVLIFGGFAFGFGPIVWLYVLCLLPLVDVHSAYRVGSAYTIGTVFIDSIMRDADHYGHLLSGDSDLQTSILSSSKKMVLTVLLSFVFGINIGSGGRTGICLALCCMVHPMQNTLAYRNLQNQITLYQAIGCSFGGICIVIIRFFHLKIIELGRRSCIVFSIFIAFSMVVIFFLRWALFTGVYIFVGIVIIVVCSLAGTLIGRKLVAYRYVPQNYVFKKSVGFGLGIFIGYICGWEIINSREMNLDDINTKYLPRFLLLTPIITFIIYESVAFMKVRNTSSIPLRHIRRSMKATIRQECYIETRLNIWDFAGERMYYNTHHLFMPKKAIYLVIFNAVQAANNPQEQIKRLQFWVQSIAIHAEIGNVAILIIGTRRDNVRDKGTLLNFSKLATIHLYKRFSKLLSFHPSGRLVFYIDNACAIDVERNILKEVIMQEIQKLTFFHESFSLKYLLFNKTLDKFRQEKSIVTSLEDIAEEARLACDITSHNELRQLLTFFDRSGDIIYHERDETLRKYVICDPQALVNILKFLVNVPELHKRDRKVADHWQKLDETGIVDSKLLAHICHNIGAWRVYPFVIRFLVGTDLLFPITVTDDVDQIGTYYLPCKLPSINSLEEIWNSNDDMQDIFYFDFGEILPEFIFLRLLSKCCKCEKYTWDKIYRNAARFRISDMCLFFITTQCHPMNNTGNNRNMIQIAVHNDHHLMSLLVLQDIITYIDEIIVRDFHRDYFQEQYVCGPVCEKCSNLDGDMRLVNLITSNNDVFTADRYRADHYHKVTLTPKLNVSCLR